MKTLLLSPELFRAEGGIARIMRLYLRALCESASAGDEVRSLTLNDPAATDPRLGHYSTASLKETIGCAGQKGAFVRRALTLARRSDRAICGHLHQLPILWLARKFNRKLQYCLVAHGIEVWRPYRWLETCALCSAHRIFCVSDYTRQQLL
ncbi:MAG TPA: glycosyltransferase, partial [Candidatus Didemnitutus sp.]|nr:glycosyltransferase [Candidatus Didemnitutus sp.]